MDTKTVSGSVNELALRWAADLFDGRSLALSAPALWPLLAFLAAGSSGATRERLARVLGQDAGQAARPARELLAMLDASPGIRATIGVWSHRDVVLDPTWLEQLPAHSHGVLTGRPVTDRAGVDAWIRDRTGGVIAALPDAPPANARLLLISALLVDTHWRDRTEPRRLTPTTGPWAGSDGLPGMYTELTDPTSLSTVYSGAGALTRAVLAGTNEVDVHLVLGEPGRSAADVVCAAIATLHDTPQWTATGQPPADPPPGVRFTRVPATQDRPLLRAVAPNFVTRTAHDLLRRRAVFGLPEPTDPPLASSPSIPALLIDEMAQYLITRFDDQGFTAAAVTTQRWIALGQPAAPYQVPLTEVTFDRPFAFLAVHRPTNLVLVAGWIAQP